MRRIEPHRLAWQALAILIGTSALVTPPAGLAAIVDPWLLYAWAGALIWTGVAISFSTLRDPVIAVAVERAAAWIQTLTLAWIIVAALWYRGMADGFGLVAYLVWITANVVRDRQIASGIATARRQAEAEATQRENAAHPEE